MGTFDRLLMAIRTIAVSTRAAVRSNRQVGRRDLSVASARRGLAMLEQLRDRLPADAPDAVRDAYERARREITDAVGDLGVTSFTIGDEESPGVSPATEASSRRRDR